MNKERKPIPRCCSCIHVAQIRSSVTTWKCRKIRGERTEDEGGLDYDDKMEVGKLRLACQFYEWEGGE